jgi:hypothetical protein
MQADGHHELEHSIEKMNQSVTSTPASAGISTAC